MVHSLNWHSSTDTGLESTYETMESHNFYNSCLEESETSDDYSFDQCSQCVCAGNRTRKKLRSPQRSSTPMQNSLSFSASDVSDDYADSVSEIFYESWEDDLYEKEKRDSFNQYPSGGNMMQNVNYYVINNNILPVCYPNQIVYINTVTTFPVIPMTCYHAVGYREDGTYGVLPGMWYCCYKAQQCC